MPQRAAPYNLQSERWSILVIGCSSPLFVETASFQPICEMSVK